MQRPGEFISIHAPSRERPFTLAYKTLPDVFQSTLPRGSDRLRWRIKLCLAYFNPRSLAGATKMTTTEKVQLLFQSSLPRGSDIRRQKIYWRQAISILAPSRERLSSMFTAANMGKFQSSLPRGSDLLGLYTGDTLLNFNPRSLAGATDTLTTRKIYNIISILAPSRERPVAVSSNLVMPADFNPRSLAGATDSSVLSAIPWSYFNPRSLTGATPQL